MIRQTHKAFATTTATAFLLTTNFYYAKINPTGLSTPIGEQLGNHITTGAIAIIIVAWLTSGLPDIDEISKRYHIPILQNINHRGFTHSIWSLILLVLPLYYTSNNIWLFIPLLGLFIGWFSHLIADAFSNQGVAWLYPLSGYAENGESKWAKHRGPFPPLYRVGTKILIPAKYYWYLITIVLLTFLYK